MRSRMRKTGKKDDKGNDEYEISSMKGMSAKIIHMGITKKADSKTIAIDIISKWPSKTQDYLVDIIKDMSGLGDEEEAKEEAKNA